MISCRKKNENGSAVEFICPLHILFLLSCLSFNFGVSHSSTVVKPFKREAEDYTERACAPPPTSPDKTVTYSKSRKPYVGDTTLIPSYVRANFQCNQGYHRVEGDKFFSICDDGAWLPEVPSCKKICDKLMPINVDITCYHNNVTIDCTRPLIPGTRVYPVCKQFYKYKDFVPVYEDIVCQEDGKWDNILFSCSPECGRSHATASPLLAHSSEPQHYSMFPWHVAIYNKSKDLICGGTIIHAQLVLSAAYCFYDEKNHISYNTEDYEVVVGKYTRDYFKIDNEFQKTFKINEIRFPSKVYTGSTNYYANDIAILVLNEGITASPSVLPACMDWIHTMYHPSKGTQGVVLGWGKTEHGEYSENLLMANLTYMSNSKCLNQVSRDFKSFITRDKFCADSKSSSSVSEGDYGGGLLVQEHGFFYIRGITSSTQPSSTGISTFTDIADHISWISSVRDEIEKKVVSSETMLVSKVQLY